MVNKRAVRHHLAARLNDLLSESAEVVKMDREARVQTARISQELKMPVRKAWA
jgi:hypothetical protein